MEKTIRIWDDNKVVAVVAVDQRGGSTWLGAVGAANTSTYPDIEIDPWAGLIVDHSAQRSPVDFREA